MYIHVSIQLLQTTQTHYTIKNMQGKQLYFI